MFVTFVIVFLFLLSSPIFSADSFHSRGSLEGLVRGYDTRPTPHAGFHLNRTHQTYWPATGGNAEYGQMDVQTPAGFGPGIGRQAMSETTAQL